MASAASRPKPRPTISVFRSDWKPTGVHYFRPVRIRGSALVASTLFIVASCAGASNADGPLLSNSPADSALAVTTTTEADEPAGMELLASQTWVDDQADRAPIEDCKIADITASARDGIPLFGSGFPTPRAELADFSNAKMWVLRIQTADESTDDANLLLTLDAFDRIVEFFDQQSFGRASLSFVHDHPSAVVQLPLTSAEYGIDNVSPQEDMSYMLNEALRYWKVPDDFRAGDQIFGILPLTPTRPSVAQGIPLGGELNGKRTGFGILMSPGSATSWILISHEIGHSWLFLEDLYSFGIQGPYENYLETWDLMAAPGGPNPGFTSWTRWRVGWLDDEQIRCTSPTVESRYFVNQLDSDSSGTKSLVFPLSDHSALVAEVRDGFGANAGKSVVVVYEVDTSYEHGNGPIRLKGTLREAGDELEQSGVRLALEAIDISGALVTVDDL